MTAGAIRDWVRTAIAGGSHERDEGVRRVATRLAAQTVVLLLVMLVALEVVVYLITEHALLGSLDSTLATRAGQADPTVCATFHLQCGRPAPPRPFIQSRQPPGPARHGPPPRRVEAHVFAPVTGPSEASAVYVDRRLHLIDHDGSLGTVLLDPQEARQALHTGQVQCCTVQAYRGQDYRVYTAPLTANGTILGAVQTSISEHQYEQTTQFLLQALLVVALLGLLTSGVVSIILVGRALQPIRLAMQRQRDFVADAAHELRTPLAIQRTVGEVGLADPSREDQGATIEQMLSENQHLTRLVEDLSLLARTDTGAVSIDRRPVDLSSLVRDTTSELEPLAEAQGVSLRTEAQDNLQGLGDLLRLRQLLLILLDNALKHTPDGGTVAVRLNGQNDRVRLQVIDSGPGIDPVDLPRIFDRFYRADRARTGEGSGLGLAIARWIVEAHGGTIQAGNTAPHGAVFTVTLPLTRPAVAVRRSADGIATG